MVLADQKMPGGGRMEQNGSNIFFLARSHNSRRPSLQTEANSVAVFGDHSKSSTSS